MKIALVHDYLLAFGGAERVLWQLCKMYPEAPIYTAFVKKGTDAAKAFADKKIIESPWAMLLKHFNLHSPLRFLMPWIWGSMDLSSYDLIITSCSGYFARGFKSGNAKVIAYCHTPPRFLYGYETSVDWQKYWIVRVYGLIVNHFLRYFDFDSAQKLTKIIVNSFNVKRRVQKYWRKDAEIIYPPIEVEKIGAAAREIEKGDFYLIASRLVGAKGLIEAIKAIKASGRTLKIVGGASGYSKIVSEIKEVGGDQVEVLGRLNDDELYKLYAQAIGFIALAKQEDFGMTVVEAMAAGTPVIAYKGGGFLETVIEDVNGVFVTDTSVTALEEAFEKIEKKKWQRQEIMESVKKFGIKRFEKEISKAVSSISI